MRRGSEAGLTCGAVGSEGTGIVTNTICVDVKNTNATVSIDLVVISRNSECRLTIGSAHDILLGAVGVAEHIDSLRSVIGSE